MSGRLLAGFAIATVVVVGGLGSAAGNLRAAQEQPATPDAPAPTASPDAPAAPALVVDESGMVALQRHAQVGMMLYISCDPMPAFASTRPPMEAVALTLPDSAR